MHGCGAVRAPISLMSSRNGRYPGRSRSPVTIQEIVNRASPASPTRAQRASAAGSSRLGRVATAGREELIACRAAVQRGEQACGCGERAGHAVPSRP